MTGRASHEHLNDAFNAGFELKNRRRSPSCGLHGAVEQAFTTQQTGQGNPAEAPARTPKKFPPAHRG
jgi:hypothetical protein